MVELEVAERPTARGAGPGSVAGILGRPAEVLLRPSPLALGMTGTPIGDMIVAATKDGLWLLEFADRPELPRELASVEKEAGHRLSVTQNKGLAAALDQLRLYFAGDLNAFRIPTLRYGTPFTMAVHDALTTIEAGTTITYKELAEKIGRPTAYRAVARANAANRLAIAVPCHRVVAQNGRLSGYAGGAGRKRWLLDHEAEHLASARGAA